jgi:hypothetical protein
MAQPSAAHVIMFGHSALMGNVLTWIHQECHFNPCTGRVKSTTRIAQLKWIELPVWKLLKAAPEQKIEQRDRS